jgi:hypothetical protein
MIVFAARAVKKIDPRTVYAYCTLVVVFVDFMRHLNQSSAFAWSARRAAITIA